QRPARLERLRACRHARAPPLRPCPRRAPRRGRTPLRRPLARDAGGVRGAHRRARRPLHLPPMTAQHAKQLVKNALYRSIGETSTALRLTPNGNATLRILMYHKVNDIPDNPTTVPVSLFDEQLAQVRELGYQIVGLDAVIDHYTRGAEMPPRAVLITF